MSHESFCQSQNRVFQRQLGFQVRRWLELDEWMWWLLKCQNPPGRMTFSSVLAIVGLLYWQIRLGFPKCQHLVASLVAYLALMKAKNISVISQTWLKSKAERLSTLHQSKSRSIYHRNHPLVLSIVQVYYSNQWNVTKWSPGASSSSSSRLISSSKMLIELSTLILLLCSLKISQQSRSSKEDEIRKALAAHLGFSSVPDKSIKLVSIHSLSPTTFCCKKHDCKTRM